MSDNYWIGKEFFSFLIVTIFSTIFLNMDIVHFQPLALWAKMLPPIFILIGGIGTVRNIRMLRFAGWGGIALFLLVSLMASFPSEDYILGGPDTDLVEIPRMVSTANILVRVAVGLVITALLFWRYRRLQTSTNIK